MKYSNCKGYKANGAYPYAPPDEMRKAAEINRDVEIGGFFVVGLDRNTSIK